MYRDSRARHYQLTRASDRNLGISRDYQWPRGTTTYYQGLVDQNRQVAASRNLIPTSGVVPTFDVDGQELSYSQILSEGKWQVLFDILVNPENPDMTDYDYNTLLNDIRARHGNLDEKMTFEVTNHDYDMIYLPFTNMTYRQLRSLLRSGYLVDEGRGGTESSDRINMSVAMRPPQKVRLVHLASGRIINNRDGDFFQRINNTELDLSDYQIFNEHQIQEFRENLSWKLDHCLFHTLEYFGIDEEVIQNLRLSYFDPRNDGYAFEDVVEDEETPQFLRKHAICIGDLERISQTIKRRIILSSYGSCEQEDGLNIRKKHYGKDILDDQPITIAMYDNHYFPQVKTEYSKYCIANYDIEEIRNHPDFQNIVGVRKSTVYRVREYTRSKDKKIYSLQLVKTLDKLGYFVIGDMGPLLMAENIKTDCIYLDTVEDDCAPFIKEYPSTPEGRKKEVKDELKANAKRELMRNMPKYMADIETYTHQGLPDYTDPANRSIYKNGKLSRADKVWITRSVLRNMTKQKRKRYFEKMRERKKPPMKSHLLKMIGVVGMDDDMVSIFKTSVNNTDSGNDFGTDEQQCVSMFLDNVTKRSSQNCLVYFHNLKYDLSIIAPYLNIVSICQKGGSVYEVKVRHGKSIVLIRDSLKMINQPLSKMNRMFSLDPMFDKGESISYNYYTPQNSNDYRVKASLYRDYLPTKELKAKFDILVEAHSSYHIVDKTFNPQAYYDEYLVLDCLVLKKAMIAMNEIVLNITTKNHPTGISVWECLTISSLADKFMIQEGAYDGVCKVSGNTRDFISSAATGGRVHVNEKYKKKVIQAILQDFDAVSSYPSAMERLCREKGVPIGIPRQMTESDIENWESHDYCIMDVTIHKVNKIQGMPFIAEKTKTGIDYVNTPPEKPVRIDSITLQDYIQFHEIIFTINTGLCWNSGFNKTMGTVIRQLFEERLIAKDNKNGSMSEILKLIMNAVYGKTLTKKCSTKKVIVTENEDNTAVKSYLWNHFNTIVSARKISNRQSEIEMYSYDASYNRGHVGCIILSYAKRGMNEVFDCANTLNRPVFYQDTDSMHILNTSIAPIADLYKKTYNRELIGDDLGQFHVDFTMGGCKDIKSVWSIFLGKKSYIDIIVGSDCETGEIKQSSHLRMKGIPAKALNYVAAQFERGEPNTDYNGYQLMYEELAKGYVVQFPMVTTTLDDSTNQFKFEYVNGQCKHMESYTRSVKF